MYTHTYVYINLLHSPPTAVTAVPPQAKIAPLAVTCYTIVYYIIL